MTYTVAPYPKSYRDVKVLVFGASGFIGRWVSRLLTLAGANTFIVVRNLVEAEQVFSRYQVIGQRILADLTDFSQVEEIIRQINPAILFNLAGYGVDSGERDESLAYRINAELPGFICDILADFRDQAWAGQAIVQVGSAAEYGSASGDLAEVTSAQPNTIYGKSKLIGTLSIKERCSGSNLPGLTARLFTVYGPGEHDGRLLPSLIDTARTKNPLRLTSGTQQRDFTYVGEAAEGILRLGAASSIEGDWVNLATGKLNSVREFATEAAQIYKIPQEKLLFNSLPTREEEMKHEPVNICRLIEWTGWKPEMDTKAGILATREFEASLLGERLERR